MQNLHRVMVIGAGLGVSSQIAALLPEPKPAKQRTAADLARLEAAEQRRQNRLERNRALNKPQLERPEPEWGWQIEQDMIDGIRAEAEQEARAMREVRRLVRPRVYRDIIEYIEDCDSTYSYEIVTKPSGNLQDEREYAFRQLFIDQYCNGGYTGDSYAGSVCIPLSAGKFLKFHYSC